MTVARYAMIVGGERGEREMLAEVLGSGPSWSPPRGGSMSIGLTDRRTTCIDLDGRGAVVGDLYPRYSQTATALTDRLLAEGMGPRAMRTLVDICALNGCGPVAALRNAARKLPTSARRYAWSSDTWALLAAAGMKPRLSDHGVPEHDVLKRLDVADFKAFHAAAESAAETAREALLSQDAQESAGLWRELFGSRFPVPGPQGGDRARSGFTAPAQAAVPSTTGRFA